MKIKDLIHELKEYSPSDIIFIGLGNEYRCDDAAGLVFIERLRKNSHFKTSHFIKAETNPENYLQKILDTKGRVIVFIDAVFGVQNKDKIFLLNPAEVDALKISTHSFSLKLIEKYLLSEKKFVFKYLCIKGSQKGFGNSLSTELLLSIEEFFRKNS